MDFWRAYRVIAARKWLITAVVVLTTTVVGVGILLYGRKWQGETWFGPTDQAVRRVVNSGNDERNAPVLTDESRIDEAKRIAAEVEAPDNAARSIYYLANAGQVRSAVAQALNGKPIDDPGQPPDYDTITSKVSSGIAQMTTDVISQTERTSGVPSALWGDIIYLDSKLNNLNISKDFLKPDRISDTINDLLKNIDVQVLNSRDITVTVANSEPRLAEILADALTASYKNVYDNQNHSAAVATVKFYTDQQMAAGRRFGLAQARLAQFRMTHKEIFLPDQVSMAIRTKDATINDINNVNANLRDMDAQISAKKATLAGLPRMLKHPTSTDNGEISALRGRIADLNTEIASKSAIWTDKNPEMVRLRAQLKSIQAELKRVQGSMTTTTTIIENDQYTALENEISRMEQSRKGLAARLGTLNTELAKQTGIVDKLPESSTIAQILSGDYSSSAERMQEVGKKLNAARDELAQTEAKGALQVRYWAGQPPGTVSHPESPAREGSVKRNWTLFIAAILLSFIGSVAVILGLDFLDTTVKSTVDVERMLDFPVNGVVPRLETTNRAMLPQVTHKLPASPQAESYRFLGTDILLTAANGDQPLKSIMVATAKPGQGGTSTICNLAITLAQAGQSVVLVDADLRRPSLHHIFNVSNEQGLTTVLSNGKLPSDVLQRTEIDNLSIMPGGPHADNAWKLLRSARMKEVIADLQRDFDFVLFDTPSAVVFADAATLATMVDGVLLVVRAHEAPSGSEMQVKNLLNKTKARIVGVVLNDMPVQQVDSARYFTHYYASARHEITPGNFAEPAAAALPKRGSDDEI